LHPIHKPNSTSSIRQFSGRGPTCWARPGPWSNRSTRSWCWRLGAMWNTQKAFVVCGERFRVRSGSKVSGSYWWDNQIANQGIGGSQCLLDATPVSTVCDVKFCRDLLVRQRYQCVPVANWLMEDRQQLVLCISNVPKLQLGYRPCLGMVFPIPLGKNASARRRRCWCYTGRWSRCRRRCWCRRGSYGRRNGWTWGP
jgi:hypothetical protein